MRLPCRPADGYVLGTDVTPGAEVADDSGTVAVAETPLCVGVPDVVETVDGRTPSSVPGCDDASAAVVPPIVRAAPATANTSTLRIAAPFSFSDNETEHPAISDSSALPAA